MTKRKVQGRYRGLSTALAWRHRPSSVVEWQRMTATCYLFITALRPYRRLRLLEPSGQRRLHFGLGLAFVVVGIALLARSRAARSFPPVFLFALSPFPFPHTISELSAPKTRTGFLFFFRYLHTLPRRSTSTPSPGPEQDQNSHEFLALRDHESPTLRCHATPPV